MRSKSSVFLTGKNLERGTLPPTDLAPLVLLENAVAENVDFVYLFVFMNMIGLIFAENIDFVFQKQRRVHNKAGNAKHNKQAHSKAGLAKSQIENKKRASE